MSINVKIGKSVVKTFDTSEEPSLEESISDFIEIKNDIDKLNEELKEIKAYLVEVGEHFLQDSENSTVTFENGDGAVKVAFGWDVNVSDEATLNMLLGDRFDDLVSVKTTYAPSSRLKEMALHDDGLKKCLTIKQKAPAVSVVK